MQISPLMIQLTMRKFRCFETLALCALGAFWGSGCSATADPKLAEQKAEIEVARATLLKVQNAVIAGDKVTANKYCYPNFLLLISGAQTGSSPRNINWKKAREWFIAHKDSLTIGTTPSSWHGYSIYSGKEGIGAFVVVYRYKGHGKWNVAFDTGVETMNDVAY